MHLLCEATQAHDIGKYICQIHILAIEAALTGGLDDDVSIIRFSFEHGGNSLKFIVLQLYQATKECQYVKKHNYMKTIWRTNEKSSYHGFD